MEKLLVVDFGSSDSDTTDMQGAAGNGGTWREQREAAGLLMEAWQTLDQTFPEEATVAFCRLVLLCAWGNALTTGHRELVRAIYEAMADGGGGGSEGRA